MTESMTYSATKGTRRRPWRRMRAGQDGGGELRAVRPLTAVYLNSDPHISNLGGRSRKPVDLNHVPEFLSPTSRKITPF